MNLARSAWPSIKHYSLKNMASNCGFVYQPHDAEEDALASAAVFIEALQFVEAKFKPFENYRETRLKLFNQNVRICDISHDISKHEINHPFYGKNVVFTGDLDSLSRSEVMQRVADVGGVVKSNVSKHTNYLIAGSQDGFTWVKDYKSAKLKKAEELNTSGHAITILNEQQFLETLNDYSDVVFLEHKIDG
jgi:DNA polymerase-3 subunit epsilon